MPILNGIDGAAGGGGLTRHGATNHLDDLELEDIQRLGIPPDAEATTVFVGQLTSLDKPAVCLVRLAESSPMAALTEVNLPVRFLFLLLGPVGDKIDYHELGRCFGTLMSSEVRMITVFHVPIPHLGHRLFKLILFINLNQQCSIFNFHSFSLKISYVRNSTPFF